METLNEQLKNSIEEKTGTRPTGDTVRETLDSASGEENSTLADALVDFIDELPGGELSPEDQALVDEMADLVGTVGE